MQRKNLFQRIEELKENIDGTCDRLFEIADSVEEIKSSCSCNKKTIFNARVDENKNILTNGNQIEIGGDDKYISLCRNCYFKGINHPLYKNNDKTYN